MNNIVIRVIVGLIGFGLFAGTLTALINKPFFELNMPQIGLEWARDPKTMGEQLNKTVKKAGEDPFKKLKSSLLGDSFLFIPLYIALFYLLANHIKTLIPETGARYFYAIIACIAFAAIADWFENYFIWKTAFLKEESVLFTYKYTAYIIKWSLIALASLIVSIGFLALGNLWVAVPGIATVILLVIGLIPNPLSPFMVQWGFGALGFVLLMAAIVV